jgi:hypothetical protein
MLVRFSKPRTQMLHPRAPLGVLRRFLGVPIIGDHCEQGLPAKHGAALLSARAGDALFAHLK